MRRHLDIWELSHFVFNKKWGTKPITVQAQSMARSFFARSNTVIVGSNPTRSVSACLHFLVFVLSCVGGGLATGWSRVEFLPAVSKVHSSRLILVGKRPEGLILQNNEKKRGAN
jgi:hypothetical protein